MPHFWKNHFLFVFCIYDINGNISQSKIVETSQFVFKPINIDLLLRNSILAIAIGPQVFKNNPIEYTKTNKYFHKII